MTIHSEHPFLPPPQDRDAVRRLRGRLPAPVTVWATGSGRDRAGLTVSSMLVADGEPAQLLALVDPESDFAEAVLETRTVAVSVLGPDHRSVGDVQAGQAPSPGGTFRTGEWTDTDWGPVLHGVPAWAGARLVGDDPVGVGYAVLLRAVVERIGIAEEGPETLAYFRGRYRTLTSSS